MAKRTCMFCGGGGLTGAHIISESLQKLLPPAEGPSLRHDIWVEPGTDQVRSDFKTINISALNHQVKRLCEKCNGKWMADIERGTKGILVSLSRGEEVRLNTQQQLDIATWATIVSMLRATQDPGVLCVTSDETNYVRQFDAPPPGFGVWIVRGESRSDAWLRHLRVVVDDAPGWLGWIWLGQALLVVSSAHLAPYTERLLRLLPSAVVQLHPQAPGVSWPVPNQVQSDVIFDLMSHDL